jgi:hypothetical protein
MQTLLSHTFHTTYTKLLLLVLFTAFVLRLFLVFSGGQNYWPDETYRYGQSRAAVNSAFSGDLKAALRPLSTPDHFLFKVIALIPATIERAVSPNLKIPAIFFTLFSTLNFWLLWKLSRIVGSSEYEALLTATLFSLTTTFFYYSRHLLPYDLGMTFGLLALIEALKQPSRIRESLLCGLMAACTFLTYNGYWTMAGFALLAHALPSLRKPDRFARRVLFSGIGFIGPILILISASAACGGKMLNIFIGFSNSITEGVFSEGWSLPFEYFWHAEHFLLFFWSVACAYCLWKAKKGSAVKQAALGLAGLLFIYGMLVVFSVGLQKFVVYGRLARQCVPFFCMLTAHWLVDLRTSNTKGGYISSAVLILIILQAGFNFYQPMVEVFPEDFRKAALKITKTSDKHTYDLLVMDHLNYLQLLPKLSSLKPHRTILQAPDPIEFLPYQYEGYTPDERNKLRSTNVHMRLIDYVME